MTSNSKEAEELIKIAKENGKIIMVDHTFEYSESINKIKGIIEAKELGDIYYMRANWLNLGLLQPDVNVIWDLVPHISSIINYISNLKPLSVSANAGAYIRKDIPEVANIHIKFSKEVTAYITVGWLEPRKTRSMTIVGSKKMLVYDLTNDEEPIKIYDKSVNLAEEIKDTRQFRVNYSYGDIHSPNVRNIESLRTMCLHFVDCIVNNKKPRSDGESGANVIKILEAAEESLKNNGKEVKLE
jgi:predicted dehydrogenase